jgi:hypothetical protein
MYETLICLRQRPRTHRATAQADRCFSLANANYLKRQQLTRGVCLEDIRRNLKQCAQGLGRYSLVRHTQPVSSFRCISDSG